MGKMIQIDDFIKELQETRRRFGNTCVYIRDVSWGAVALGREAEDEAVEQMRAADGVVGSPVYGATSRCTVCKKRIVYSEDGWLHCEPQDHGLARPDEEIQNPPRR